MAMLKGITVTLINRKVVGKDPLGTPIYEDVEVEVSNVLVSPTSAEDTVNQLTLTGKKAVYTLAIPKGDTNTWEDQDVMFFGKRWKVFGPELQGIEDMIPLDWNKKVMVERYE
jgi:hypothetical protein